MEAFETTLTGSAGPINGVVTLLSKNAYQFSSIDGALELTITKNPEGRWIRLAGSEPYFSGWVDELSEKIATQPASAHVKAEKSKPVPIKKAEAKPIAKKQIVKPAVKAASPIAKKETTKTAATKPATSVKPAATKKETTKPSIKKEATKPAAKKITEKTGTVKKAKVSSGSTKTK